MRCSTNGCRPNVFEEFDRGLNHFMQGVLTSDDVRSDDPRVSVLEFADRFVVECDLPGVALDAISVQIEKNVLSIRGKRSSVTSDDEVKVVLNERRSAEFSRNIELSRDVDQSAVDAELSQGVLKIVIPKRPEVLPQKIEIKRTPC